MAIARGIRRCSRKFAWSPRIAIIGAGFGGLGTAIKLLDSGLTSFTVYERYPRSGGVWVVNKYPGAEVDTESEAYRLSSRPYPWTRSHAQRDELLHYFDHVVSDPRLRQRIRYNAKVVLIEWQDNESQYLLHLADGSTDSADVVVSAVGFLGEAQLPDWPGLSEFNGRVFHSSQWDDDLDLSGKIVAVVGTGSTSASIVPTIATEVKQLYVYQREPGWVLPKPIAYYDDAARARRMRPLARRRNRVKSLYAMKKLLRGGRAVKIGSRENRTMQAKAAAYLESSFSEHPELREMLRPSYPIFGKRVVLSADYYDALKRDNVELIPHAVAAVSQDGVVDDAGCERKVDVLVLATGFKAAQFLSSLPVVGRDGIALQEHWAGDPRAFLGIAVPKFPNLFIIYGPSTSGSGGILYIEEAQMRFAVDSIVRLARMGRRVTEVREGHNAFYQRWLDRNLQGLVFDTTHNYFKGATGRTVTQWPKGFVHYAILARVLRRSAMRASGPTVGAQFE